MSSHIEENKRPLMSKVSLIKIIATAVVLFWIYVILNSLLEMRQQLKLTSDQSVTVHNLQVEYKNEVQEWKNLLLRSNNLSLLEKNWAVVENKYRGVDSTAQATIQKSDVRRITEPLKTFVAAHADNFQQYKNTKDQLFKNGFTVQQADALVKGIDRPLLDHLALAAEAVQDEKANADARIVAKAVTQAEQGLIAIVFILLLVVWMPKW